jgi:hypothetical protein
MKFFWTVHGSILDIKEFGLVNTVQLSEAGFEQQIFASRIERIYFDSHRLLCS